MAKIVIPTAPSELEELLSDSARVTEAINEGQFAEIVAGYARATYDRDLSLHNQVTEQVDAVMGEFLKNMEDDAKNTIKRPNLVPAMREPGRPNQNARNVYNPKALGSVLDSTFDGMGDFFSTIASRNQTAAVAKKLDAARNAFSTNIPSEGGFLVPETLRADLLRVALESGVVRQRARVIPMETLRVPFPAIDSTSNVSSVYGGIVAYWTEEAAALTASSATFKRIVLDAKKLTAYTEVPSELVSDSLISFTAFIEEIFPEALSWYEDIAFISGTGVGEPLGVLNAANGALVTVAKEVGQPTATIVWENIVKMYARMLPGSLARAVWVVSPDTFAELATMSLSVGTGGSAIWLNNGQQGPPMTILGRPVIVSEKVSILGAAGDVNFIDFGFYLIGDRQVMSAQSSTQYKFGNDLIAYRVIQRLDGRPWLESAITPKNAGPTMSPFVQLAARP